MGGRKSLNVKSTTKLQSGGVGRWVGQCGYRATNPIRLISSVHITVYSYHSIRSIEEQG